jgi:peroxiredoxin Q/BCP
MATRRISEGAAAPDVTGIAQDGTSVSLADHLGRWVVVYFYPADDTPGCTAEACGFRDSYQDFTDAGAVVIGVSGDSTASHERFATKHRLPFTLLTDDDGSLRQAFGVGKTLGILPERVTFVIDPEGVVRKVFSSQLRATRHQAEALAAIRSGAAAA